MISYSTLHLILERDKRRLAVMPATSPAGFSLYATAKFLTFFLSEKHRITDHPGQACQAATKERKAED